ncbi:MAG TPA: phosphatidylglycerol lysyltransferase domain-containing protein [Nitrospiria bacterium]|nr:phosphatidylglycerol lysyltransferase domain-containing protein [Nitrospiria bacterium]
MAPEPIPQIIPNLRCLRCDVCCRFPDAGSPMRPYFTAAEIEAAIARGVPVEYFPERSGGRVALTPHPAGEGFVCPAFDVGTNRCAIYDDRPLDCRLYPFVVIRSPEGGRPLLGWDQLCPYLREEADPMLPLKTVPIVAEWLCPSDAPSPLEDDPGFVGPFQASVWMMEPLTINRVETPPASPPVLPGVRFFPVEDDRNEIERLQGFLLDAVEPPLSTGHPAVLLMWRPIMSLYWADLEEGTALLARQASTYFAPVPPRPDPGCDLASVCRRMLALLNRLNANPSASRIERLGPSQCRVLRESGMVCRPEGEEYLYDRSALAALRGDAYKSQRWNCNQAARRFRPTYGPYSPGDLIDCLRLYAGWRRRKEWGGRSDDYAAALMSDGFYAHWQALAHADDWGLAARVARVEGRIRAYTVGAPLNDRTMLILHEIADPACSGLGPWLFREWCREWERYELVNVMDDCDLLPLRKAKERYRPMYTAASFAVAQNPPAAPLSIPSSSVSD